MLISIVIPVYNGGANFQRCLASVTDSLTSADEVIVVADGDTDGSWQVAEAFGAKVLQLPISGGPARARNIGAQTAQGNLLFFMDADVTLHPQTLGLVKQEFERTPNLAALIGSYDDEPGADNFLSQYKNLFHHYTHQMSSENASTFWGACGAIRRSVFEVVGGFDESYRHPCIEDIELGYRLKQMGYSIRLCKNIQVKHLKQWQLGTLLKAEIFHRALPWTELILRNRYLNADLNLNHTNRFSVVLIFALVLSLLSSCFVPRLFLLNIILVLILSYLNLDLYCFFYQKRGLRFTLQVIPWHWLYFLYGGASFVYQVFRYYLKLLPSDERELTSL
ncbi:MAG: glycosyltransferase [Cyanobacteria bacterium]|jgi:glycosyltransferase involved in cell wall biosynthesis|nr:glycosyltransferase [Cyanobacteria bacterium GSL.Bin1]